jgi:hypothetical protein
VDLRQFSVLYMPASVFNLWGFGRGVYGRGETGRRLRFGRRGDENSGPTGSGSSEVIARTFPELNFLD